MVVTRAPATVTWTLTKADAFAVLILLGERAVELAWEAKDLPGSAAWREYLRGRSLDASRLADDLNRAS